jgi:hypothetical protein
MEIVVVKTCSGGRQKFPPLPSHRSEIDVLLFLIPKTNLGKSLPISQSLEIVLIDLFLKFIVERGVVEAHFVGLVDEVAVGKADLVAISEWGWN